MATIDHEVITTVDPNYSRIMWPNLSVGDVGEGFLLAGNEVQSIQHFGAHATGNILIEGNNAEDSDQFFPIELTRRHFPVVELSILDRALSKVYYIRPRVILGNEQTSITVVMFLKKV
jgi:hypothetical protein